MSDWIEIDRFVFACRIGVHAGEQDREQPIALRLRLGLDLEGAASGDLAQTIDYARILQQVELIGRYGQWRLLESLAVVLARWFLLAPGPGERRAAAQVVGVRLEKPEACAGRALPSVEVTRDRERLDGVETQLTSGVRLDRVSAPSAFGVYRLSLAPATTWRPRLPAHARATWMSLGGNAIIGHARLEEGAVRVGAIADPSSHVTTEAEPLTALVLSEAALTP